MSSINTYTGKLYDCMVLIDEKEYHSLKDQSAKDVITSEQTMEDNNAVTNLEVNNEGGVVLLQPKVAEDDTQNVQNNSPTSAATNDEATKSNNKFHHTTENKSFLPKKSLTNKEQQVEKGNSRALIRVYEKGHKNPTQSELNQHKEKPEAIKDIEDANKRKILKPKTKLVKSRKRKRKEDMEDKLFEKDVVTSSKQRKVANFDSNDKKETPMDTSEPKSYNDYIHTPLKKPKFKNSLFDANENEDQTMDYENQPSKKTRKRNIHSEGSPPSKKSSKESRMNFITQRFDQLKGKKRKSNVDLKNTEKRSKRTPSKRSRATIINTDDSSTDDENQIIKGKRQRNQLADWSVSGKRKRGEQSNDINFFAERFLPQTTRKSTFIDKNMQNNLFDNDGDYIML